LSLKESLRVIVAEESIRAVFLGLILLPVWAILVIEEVVPLSGWSFLAVVPGVSLLIFALVVGLRARTGWRLLAPQPQSVARWERNLTLLLLWVLVSLLAISIIGEQPYLALAIAIVGGIVLGIVAVRSFEAGLRARAEGQAEPSDTESEQSEGEN
jgi:hypothetical protein